MKVPNVSSAFTLLGPASFEGRLTWYLDVQIAFYQSIRQSLAALEKLKVLQTSDASIGTLYLLRMLSISCPVRFDKRWARFLTFLGSVPAFTFRFRFFSNFPLLFHQYVIDRNL